MAKGGNSIPWPILRIASRCAKKVAKGGIEPPTQGFSDLRRGTMGCDRARQAAIT